MSQTTDKRNKFQMYAWWLFWFTTPDFWRRLTTGRVRMRIFLDTGQSFKMSVSDWNNTRGTTSSYSYSGAANSMSVDPARIVGFREVLYW